jgi:hypothetical protein
MKAKLTYFKDTGKYYGEGEMEIDDPNRPLFEVWAQVRHLMKLQRLPGLVENHSNFIVLVNVPDHPHDHPRLMFPE